MGNNIASCVECVDDEVAAGDSSIMQTSTYGGTRVEIPETAETTEDRVTISSMKPLGITLCDSSTATGVYVTLIKSDGNVAKLKQSLSVGMLLLELNGEDVSSATLDVVINKIKSAAPEQILNLKFSGTKPVQNCHSAGSSQNDNIKTQSSNEKSDEGAKETEMRDEKAQNESQVQTKNSTPDQIDSTKEKSNEPNNESDCMTETENSKNEPKKEETETNLGERPTPEKEEDDPSPKRSESNSDNLSSTEEEFGEFSSSHRCDSALSTKSMDTVDITTPDREVRFSEHVEEVENLNDVLSNEDLSVDEEDESSAGKLSAPRTNIDKKSAPQTNIDKKSNELFKCGVCKKKLTKESFTSSQLKKKSERKCNDCK